MREGCCSTQEVIWILSSPGAFATHLTTKQKLTHYYRVWFWQKDKGILNLTVVGDSKLIISRARHNSLPKNIHLRTILIRIQSEIKTFRAIEFFHVLRENNQDADRQANLATKQPEGTLLVNGLHHNAKIPWKVVYTPKLSIGGEIIGLFTMHDIKTIDSNWLIRKNNQRGIPPPFSRDHLPFSLLSNQSLSVGGVTTAVPWARGWHAFSWTHIKALEQGMVLSSPQSPVSPSMWDVSGCAFLGRNQENDFSRWCYRIKDSAYMWELNCRWWQSSCMGFYTLRAWTELRIISNMVSLQTSENSSLLLCSVLCIFGWESPINGVQEFIPMDTQGRAIGGGPGRVQEFNSHPINSI